MRWKIYYYQPSTFLVDLEFIDQLLYVRSYCITAVIVVLVRQSFSDKKKKGGVNRLIWHSAPLSLLPCNALSFLVLFVLCNRKHKITPNTCHLNLSRLTIRVQPIHFGGEQRQEQRQGTEREREVMTWHERQLAQTSLFESGSGLSPSLALLFSLHFVDYTQQMHMLQILFNFLNFLVLINKRQ